LSINKLHKAVLDEKSGAEENLFRELSVRFRLFTYQRIVDEETANDLVQEALATILREYRQTVFEISFSAWAYHVLINKLRNYYRQRKRHGSLFEPKWDMDSQPDSWQPEPMLESALIECLGELGQTSLRFARILYLRYQGYGTDDICAKLDISADNFYVVLSRSRSLMRKCLDKKGVLR